jgi:hypothetical protein
MPELSGNANAVGTMVARRKGHVTLWIPALGKVLTCGGEDENGNIRDDAELIDLSTGVSVWTGKMTTPRAYHAGCLLHDSRAVFSGGRTPGGTSDSCEFYYYTSRELNLSPAEFARDRDHFERLNSTVRKVREDDQERVRVHRPGGFFLAALAGLSSPRANHSMIMLPNGSIFVSGGDSGSGALAKTELYRPALAEEMQGRTPF